MHPTVAEYPYLLGIARLQLAESDGAVEALRRSLELDPDQVLPYVALGLSYKDQKRYAESREFLTRGLRATEPEVIAAQHPSTGSALSDHEAVAVTLEPDAGA